MEIQHLQKHIIQHLQEKDIVYTESKIGVTKNYLNILLNYNIKSEDF